MKTLTISALALASAAPSAFAQQMRVRVTFENLAPTQGTYHAPVWIGFHDGSFDLFDLGSPAQGPNAVLANDAIEHLAEDGATGGVAAEFLASGAGTVEGTLLGPEGPIGPGQRASASFLLDPQAASSRYVSYASMAVPSNDAFIANDDPTAIPAFDLGALVAPSVFVLGAQVLDAGTEVNDEVPMNTAFLGQMTPDTGADQGGTIALHPGFLPPGSGGILDAPRFSQADFTAPGYPMAKLRFEGAPAITALRRHGAFLHGAGEVPAVATPASGQGTLLLVDGGTRVRYFFRFDGLQNVVGAHLHLGRPGENGPIVVDLVEPANGDANPFPLPPGGGAFTELVGEFDASALAGPLEARPLDALAAEMEAANVYVNVHTDDGQPGQDTGPGDFASGEVRGLVRLF